MRRMVDVDELYRLESCLTHNEQSTTDILIMFAMHSQVQCGTLVIEMLVHTAALATETSREMCCISLYVCIFVILDLHVSKQVFSHCTVWCRVPHIV